MANPSNHYAQTIFSKYYPISMWTLDGEVDYLSWITEDQRVSNLTSPGKWSGTSSIAQFNNDVFPLYSPMDSVSVIANATTISGNTTATFISNMFVEPVTTDKSISIGFYVFAYSAYLDSVDITFNGYTQTFSDIVAGKWTFVEQTFTNTASSTIQIDFNFTTTEDSSSDKYKFIVNGLTAGSWSEEYHMTSLGTNAVDAPNDLPINSLKVIEAKSYGVSGTSGYYIAGAARNTSVPMVYGSSNVTVLSKTQNGDPSLIFPSFGFMNESGKHTQITFEAWMKFMPQSNKNTKIFGPTNNADGLYANDSSLVLKIGKKIGSYSVGEWNRPMLIQIGLFENSATLCINGEPVITLLFNALEANFANADSRWLGVYCSDEIPSILIDCITIYPYKSEPNPSKQRYAIGQAVDFAENLNSSTIGRTVYPDFAHANYTKNYYYSMNAIWKQTSNVDNLNLSKNSLATPDPKIPDILVPSTTTSIQLLDDIYAKNILDSDDFITMLPNQDWDGVGSYISFSSLLDYTNEKIKTIYGTFELPEDISTRQTIFKLIDQISQKYIKVELYNSKIRYVHNASGDQTTIYEDYISSSTATIVGIDLEYFINMDQNFSSFLSNQKNLSLYVAGSYVGLDVEQIDSFLGKIKNVHLSSAKNSADLYSSSFLGSEDDPIFQGNGVIEVMQSRSTQVIDFIKDKVSTYTLKINNDFGFSQLDRAAKSQWIDSLPLSMFSSIKTDVTNTPTDVIDYIQYNIGYHNFNKFDSENIDTSFSSIKTYLSFRYDFLDRSYVPRSSNPTPKTLMVIPGEYWEFEEYEVVDNMIIYPPTNIEEGKSINDIYMDIDVNIYSRSIYSNPTVKTLQLSSNSTNYFEDYAIGTSFGDYLIVEKLSKEVPIITKYSSPYLFLSDKSGVMLSGEDFHSNIIKIPINNTGSVYNIESIQMCFKVLPEAVSGEVKLFSISAQSNNIDFYLSEVFNEGSRARIIAKDSGSGNIYTGISFFWNGLEVINPMVTMREWGILNIAFTSPIIIDYASDSYLSIVGPMIVNAVSLYQSNAFQRSQSSSARSWFYIKNGDSGVNTWSYWKTKTGNSWLDAETTTATPLLSLDPIKTYNTHVGTNVIVVDADTNEHKLRFNKYEYKTYMGVQRQSKTFTAI